MARYGPKPHGRSGGVIGVWQGLQGLRLPRPHSALGAGGCSAACQGNCWPSLMETPLRSTLPNCQSSCLTPGAAGDVIYPTVGTLWLQTGKLLLPQEQIRSLCAAAAASAPAPQPSLSPRNGQGSCSLLMEEAKINLMCLQT